MACKGSLAFLKFKLASLYLQALNVFGEIADPLLNLAFVTAAHGSK